MNASKPSARATHPRWRPFICIGCLAASFVLVTAPRAQSLEYRPTPVELEFERHAQQVLSHRSTSEAHLHLLQAYALLEHVGPSKMLAFISEVEALTSTGRDDTDLKQRALYLRGALLLRMGRAHEARVVLGALSFLTDFQVVGPFDNEGGSGWARSEGLDLGTEERSPMRGQLERPVRWRSAPPEASTWGYVHLESVIYPARNVCAYARTDILADHAMPIVLRFGAAGAFKAFLNGALIAKDKMDFAHDFDRRLVSARLKSGKNRLLVKVCNKERTSFGFMVRATDKLGRPLHLRTSTADIDDKHLSQARGPRPGRDLLAVFSKRAARSQASTLELYRAAAWMHLTGALDPGLHRARDWAKKACDALEKAEHCLLWSSLSSDRNEQHEAISAALAIDPDDFEAGLALGHWQLSGFNHALARPTIESLAAAAPRDPRIVLLSAELLARDGFSQSALSYLNETLAPDLEPPSLLHAGAFLAEQINRTEERISFLERLLAIGFTSRSAQQALARDALSRSDMVEFRTHLDSLMTLAPFEDATWTTAATLFEGAELYEDALEAHRFRVRLSPDNPDAVAALGFYLTRRGQISDGLDQLSRALDLRPQDVEVRRYLDHVQARTSLIEGYNIAPEEFLKKVSRHTSPKYPVTYLVDQTVVHIQPSGLASRFVQYAALIHNDDAARNWRYQYISFVPTTERLRVLQARVFRPDGTIAEVIGRGMVPTSEPWYRLYYDVNAEVLEMPPLSPGDVVEVSYRLDDIATHNVFHDYFGDLQLIEDQVPKQLWRYVAIVPASRRLSVGPIDAPVNSSISTKGDNLVYTFETKRLPAVHREEDMGGTTSGMGYLHLSTYTSWDALGAWYQGLIAEQLNADRAVSLKAHQLIAGAQTIREKVDRIYRYVIESTRYVGLEFGIYGYKPYKVSEVFSRGFGDCKDKASLLVAMLGEVGIPAELVLLRTRHVGEIDPTPASLSAFNHAIAHVPSLDLWLDGTAEHHGSAELPFQDQGVLALRIGQNGALITRTPIAPPAADSRLDTWRIALAADGDAVLEGEFKAVGPLAASLRRELEVEQSRVERFGATLALWLDHAQLLESDFEEVTDPNAPVSISYAAKIPALAQKKNGVLALPSLFELNLTTRYVRAPRRGQPLVVGPAQYREKRIEIVSPPGYRVASTPPSLNISSRFGSLSVDVQIQGGRVSLRRVFELTTHEIAPDNYGSFAEFCRDVDRALQAAVVFEPVGVPQ